MQTLQSMLVLVPLALLGGWLVYHVTKALRTGIANAAGTGHRRSENPKMYWITVAIQSLFALLCLAMLAMRVSQHS